jgi:hypothetical protein
MKKLVLVALLVVLFSSCNVTESIVINENGSGKFLVTYNMGDAMKAMTSAMGSENSEQKESGQLMDTTMVFADIMEMYKDSIAALPEEKRLAMEAVKDMFMTMQMDEKEGIMDMGIGLNFESIEDLKGINEKLKKVQSLNAQSDQVDALKENSPLGSFMGNENNNVSYDLQNNLFTRVSSVANLEDSNDESLDGVFDDTAESNQEFIDYFENAFYTVKLTFPRVVKSVSLENAELSEDGKTVTYKTNWVAYLKNPKLLDVNVVLADE